MMMELFISLVHTHYCAMELVRITFLVDGIKGGGKPGFITLRKRKVV
jgi:hypothetical protein